MSRRKLYPFRSHIAICVRAGHRHQVPTHIAICVRAEGTSPPDAYTYCNMCTGGGRNRGAGIDGFGWGGARATGAMNSFKRIGHFAARCLHILQYVYGRRMERESGLFPRLTPIQSLLTDSFPGNGNLRRLHPRLSALLLLHRSQPSRLHQSHAITSRVTVSTTHFQTNRNHHSSYSSYTDQSLFQNCSNASSRSSGSMSSK